MLVHVYTMAHNEEILMPYFMRHYRTVADRITVYDNESDDATVKIAQDAGAIVIPYHGKYSDRSLLEVKSEQYKKDSRGQADWVIALDVDEFIWHPDLRGILGRYLSEGVTLPRVQGYEMFADGPPTGNGQVYDEIKMGIEGKWSCKRAVFHPSIDINFGIGCHFCEPKGNVKESEKTELKLLHYRGLGAKYLASRWRERVARQSEENVKNKWSPVIGTTDQSAQWWITEVTKQFKPFQVVP